MKQLISLIFLLILPFILHSQTTGSVSIRIIDSRNVESSNYNDDVMLYRIDNGIIDGRMLDFSYNDSVFVDNLDSGLYHFSCQNMYGQKIDKLLSVKTGTHADFRIAIDSLTEYDNNIFKDFTERDTLILFYKTTGCFEYDVKKILITKDSGFVAKLYECDYKYLPEGDFSVQNGTYITGALVKEVKMNDKQVAAFIRFENELSAFTRKDDCTTTTYYKLIHPDGFIIDREDGGCEWYGYAYLEASIFGFEY